MDWDGEVGTAAGAMAVGMADGVSSGLSTLDPPLESTLDNIRLSQTAGERVG